MLELRLYRLSAVILTLAMLVGAAGAQPSAVELGSNESQRVTCASGLSVVPESPTAVLVVCGGPDVVTFPTPTTTWTAEPTSPPPPTAPPTAAPSRTPSPTAAPGAPAGGSLWLSPAEVAALPMSGAGWSAVDKAAKGSWGS